MNRPYGVKAFGPGVDRGEKLADFGKALNDSETLAQYGLRTRRRLPRASLLVAMVVLGLGLLALMFAPRADAQGANPYVPRHFTLEDVNVAPGQLVTVPLWLEVYEQKHIIHLRFEIDPDVAEFVGATPGKDLKLLAQGGCWNLEDDAWVQTANERPFNEGWQLNYLLLSCFGCGADGITGSIGGWLDLGIQSRYHIADIIIRGNAVGETPIWLDRRCSGEPQGGGNIPGSRDSRMSWYVNSCPGLPNSGSAHYCIRDPGTFQVQYVSFSNEFLPPPEIRAFVEFDELLDPMIVVRDDDCDDDVDDDDCVPVARHTWGMVKKLYR